jgi:hypothetical protein
VEQIFDRDTVFVNTRLAQYTSSEYRQQEKAEGGNLEKVAKTEAISMEMPVTEAETLTREQLYTLIMASPGWEGSTMI